MEEKNKLVQITEEEAKRLKLVPIDLSKRDLPLANDGSLMLIAQPADGGPVTVNSCFELPPESLVNQQFVPEESTRYSVYWGPVIFSRMFSLKGRPAYIKFY